MRMRRRKRKGNRKLQSWVGRRRRHHQKWQNTCDRFVELILTRDSSLQNPWEYNKYVRREMRWDEIFRWDSSPSSIEWPTALDSHKFGGFRSRMWNGEQNEFTILAPFILPFYITLEISLSLSRSLILIHHFGIGWSVGVWEYAATTHPRQTTVYDGWMKRHT